MIKKYNIVYADPAWSFNNKKTGGSLKSGASSHYKTMGVDEMCKMNIPAITQKDCVLFMWWVASQPEEAIKLVKALGFTIKTMTAFNWVKTTKHGKFDFGMGFWTRVGSEMCLVAIKGKPKRISARIRSVTMAQKLQHSKKPDIFRDKIVQLMGDVPRVELFAREKYDGWDSMGDEINDGIELPLKILSGDN